MTLIAVARVSARIASASVAIPALVAEYTWKPGIPRSAATDEITTK